VANLLVTILFWLNGSKSLIVTGLIGPVLIAQGRLLGLLAELFILLQLVLIARIQFIEKEFGFDKLNVIHRIVGYCLGYFIILHPILLITGYSIDNESLWWNQASRFLQKWPGVLLATVALGLMILLIAASIGVIRKKLKYETWHFTHFFFYLAVALVFIHQIKSGDVSRGSAFYYWFVLNFLIFGFVIAYRFLRPIYLYFKHQFVVEKVIKEAESVYSVYISGHNLDKFTFNAGQYCNINFVAKKIWHNHPFSFSNIQNGKYLRFTIKESGDFTSKISKIKPGTRVVIDGPLGAFTGEKNIKEKFLFIAGGIGITPLLALMQSFIKEKKDVVLLYANRTIKDAAFIGELNAIGYPYHLILSNEQNPKYEQGYINVEKVKRLIPDAVEREVYICGPGPMMKAVDGELQKMGLVEGQIHYENFMY